MLLTALVITALTTACACRPRPPASASAARRRCLALSRELAAARTTEEIAAATVRHVRDVLERARRAARCPTTEPKLVLQGGQRRRRRRWTRRKWASRNGPTSTSSRPAAGTDTLPAAARHLPAPAGVARHGRRARRLQAASGRPIPSRTGRPRAAAAASRPSPRRRPRPRARRPGRRSARGLGTGRGRVPAEHAALGRLPRTADAAGRHHRLPPAADRWPATCCRRKPGDRCSKRSPPNPSGWIA